MSTHDLRAYRPGCQVTLHCQTSAVPIYYKGLPERDRKPFVANAAWAQLSEIPYLVTGKVVGVEDTGEVPDYLVLLTEGEAAVLAQTRNGIRIVGTEIRLKTVHVPVGAIKRVVLG